MTQIARISTASGQAEWALAQGDQLVSLRDVVPAGIDEIAALSQLATEGVSAQTLASAPRLNAKDVTWQMPLSRPGKIICLGLNYAAHAAEGGHKTPEYPAFFMRGATSLMAHRAPMVRPQVSDKFDFEAEVGVVIGKRARHLTRENALQAVLGYACFNDGSVRDYQRKSSQWTIGKNFDGTGAFGPWLVPARDVPAGASGLKIESRLNGQVMQSDNTANMIVSVADALVLLSEAITLEPGDLIAMGTPSGVGYARTPPVFMQPGDTIEIEIEGLGLLSNPVVQEAAR